MTSPHPGRDALEVGLALAFILSFTWNALTRIALARKADEGRRWVRAMESAVPLPVDPRELRTPVVLPTERRTRDEDDVEEYAAEVTDDSEESDADDDWPGATGPYR